MAPQTISPSGHRPSETRMLGYSLANAVNFAGLRIGIKNHVPALWANQIKGRLVAFQSIGFSLDIVFGHHGAVSIYVLVAAKSISRGDSSAGFQAGPDGV